MTQSGQTTILDSTAIVAAGAWEADSPTPGFVLFGSDRLTVLDLAGTVVTSVDVHLLVGLTPFVGSEGAAIASVQWIVAPERALVHLRALDLELDPRKWAIPATGATLLAADLDGDGFDELMFEGAEAPILEFDPFGPADCVASPAIAGLGPWHRIAAVGDWDGDGDDELAALSELGRSRSSTVVEPVRDRSTSLGLREGVRRFSASLVLFGIASIAVPACGMEPEPDDDPLDLRDDAYAYLTNPAYRRAILERDLVSTEPVYAQVRLSNYAVTSSAGEPEGWDALPVIDWPTAALTLELADELATTQTVAAVDWQPPLSGTMSDGAPESLPSSRAEWVALGERVFFEYPMAVAPSAGRALRAGIDLRDYGLLVHDGAYVGLRLLQAEGRTLVGVTCASCHASIGSDGRPSGVRANRDYDMGRLVFDFGIVGEQLAVDTTTVEHLAQLGPGRSDVQQDGEFNPYAYPDFGGIVDMPYLHHTANWHHRGVATLAIRIETVFVSTVGVGSRPPRVLAWALAEYLRSLPAPPPVAGPSAASERGRAVFEGQGCDGCHTPPLYSSQLRVSVAELGTDDAAGISPVRGTGYWRVPSLRGVGGNAPYLHHGAFADLEAMFNPTRDEPGHTFGLGLNSQDRADLLAFLRTI